MFYLVKTMRKFYFYLIGMLLTFAACSEETEITPVGETYNSQARAFVDVLEFRLLVL